MNVIVSVSPLTVTDVTVSPCALTMFIVLAFPGVIAAVSPDVQAIASVKITGVKRGREEVGSPPSGASMIHSQEPPLKLAPGGGASVMLKWVPVVLLAKAMVPAVLPTYCTEQLTVWPGATGKLAMLVCQM
jgi:hypothetical protein